MRRGKGFFSYDSHKDLCLKVSGSFWLYSFNFNVYLFLWLAHLKINP